MLVRALTHFRCGGVLALSTSADPASAHAALLETSPAEDEVLDAVPDSAELRFNEPVELIDGAIRLFPSSGDVQTLEAQTRDHSVIVDLPRGKLPDGTYSLTYRIVSADGHPVGGAVTFHIGEESDSAPAPTTPDADSTPTSTETAVIILTVMQYLGLLTFAGLLFFDAMVRRSPARPDRTTRRVAHSGIGLGVMASFLLIPVSALRITGQALTSIVDLSSWVLRDPGSTDDLSGRCVVGRVLGTAIVRPTQTLKSRTTRGRHRRSSVDSRLTGARWPLPDDGTHLAHERRRHRASACRILLGRRGSQTGPDSQVDEPAPARDHQRR